MELIRRLFQRLKEERGVTLIELLAVIIILGIIAAIGVPAILNSRENAQIATYQSNAKILEEAAKRKILDGEVYTSGTGSLSDDAEEFNLTELLEEVGIDTDTGNITNGTDEATFDLTNGKGTFTMTPDGDVTFEAADDSEDDDENAVTSEDETEAEEEVGDETDTETGDEVVEE